MHFERQNAFENAKKNIIFPEKSMCAYPTYNVQTCYLKHTYILIWPNKVIQILLNSFLASSDFCHLLITFPNSLDPAQDRLDVGPDLDPNHLTP